MNRIDLKSLTIMAIAFCASLNVATVSADQREAPRSHQTRLRRLSARFKIDIVTTQAQFPIKTRFGLIDGMSADKKELERYTRLFADEFGLYPPSLIRKTKLKRVVLCKKLSFAGQRRNAVPDFEHNTLYLEVSRGKRNGPYMRKVIHHEFFHIIDYADDGKVYQDKHWQALNSVKFRYGSGGRNAQGKPSTSVLTDKYAGFLNHYSTTGVEEDKAEIFANMIVDFAHVEKRAGKDDVVRAKIKLMKTLLLRFCPDINERFWKNARILKRQRSVPKNE